MSRNANLIGYLVLVAAVVVAPLVFSNYRTYQFGYVALFLVALSGLNLLTGFTGQISLGHGAFIGVLENLSGGFVEPWLGGGVKAVAPFVALLVILLFRPYGLFGTREIERL